MQPSGLAHVEAAKKDGRWQAAYERPSTTKIPTIFLDHLKDNPIATKNFEQLTKAQKYTIAIAITTAVKEETKQRRIAKYIDLLNNNQKF
ncbi:MAG: hypothetical protein HC932_01080 [Thermales bacterium]|nr:hypothetical protein [Thermales bacterium]